MCPMNACATGQPINFVRMIFSADVQNFRILGVSKAHDSSKLFSKEETERPDSVAHVTKPLVLHNDLFSFSVRDRTHGCRTHVGRDRMIVLMALANLSLVGFVDHTV